jgi:cytosine/adenosine deaminase-related metal-dependent hydrolase
VARIALDIDSTLHPSDENIAAGEPYPDAVETVREWRAAGHWIHITSHRAESCAPATARWLDQIGLPFDDLHCSQPRDGLSPHLARLQESTQ